MENITVLSDFDLGQSVLCYAAGQLAYFAADLDARVTLQCQRAAHPSATSSANTQ